MRIYRCVNRSLCELNLKSEWRRVKGEWGDDIFRVILLVISCIIVIEY